MKNLSWSRFSSIEPNGSRTRAGTQSKANSILTESGRPVDVPPANISLPIRRFVTFSGLAALDVATTLLLVAENGPPQHYQQTNLVSDVPGLATVTDANLVNAWGLSRCAAETAAMGRPDGHCFSRWRAWFSFGQDIRGDDLAYLYRETRILVSLY